MFKELFASILLSGSIGAKTQVISPRIEQPFRVSSSIDYSRSNQSPTGVYNFRNSFDYTGLDAYFTGNGVYSYNYEVRLDRFPNENGGMPHERHTAPISIGNRTAYIETITFDVASQEYDVSFNYYYTMSYDHIYSVSLGFETELRYFSQNTRELLFNIRDYVTLEPYSAAIFDCLFTHDDNDYVTTYNGYISFFNIVNYTDPFTCFGTEIVDGSMYLDLLSPIRPDNPSGGSWASLAVEYRNYLSYDYNIYEDTHFSYPLNPPTRSWLVSNFKMSLTSQTNLGYISYYGYIRDTSYDNATFKDLLFGVVDSPIYFVSSLLSFELFGVNLFIALTGLLTLIVILVLIKKFW